MEPLYNIYFAGEVLEGQDRSTVRARLATLFKANDAALDKLFSGKPQLVKRDCDKDTALKYKKAMEQAGAKPLISSAKPAAEPAAEPAPAPRALSAAERIAALANAPDVSAAAAPAPAREAARATEPAPAGDGGDGLRALPTGGELLRPSERSQPEAVAIDISALSAEGNYGRLAAVAPPPPPPPATAHLSMGEVGETIPTLPPQHAPLSPDISALALSPEGTDFSDCALPDAEIPELDLSGIDLAAEGSDMLEAQYRQQRAVAPPATDHLSVEE
ncbi:hypothetical protein [Haliea sp. E17]|uniref:hypothetical protein n=1 Tax=Haliea sp. E17 TaxID=3401576 RepID=UPI003AAF857B